MNSLYNRIAGQSLERIGALSDGVFAIAMTLLVLDLHVPVGAAIHSEADLWTALVALGPRFLTYVMSFQTLGIFWLGQQTHLSQLERSNRSIAWSNIVFLAAVSILPFTTALLSEFITYRLALGIYWLNLLVLGLMLFISRRYASRTGLVKADVTAEQWAAGQHRIVEAQSLYAVGALLCLFDTYWSIAAIVLVQLNYSILPWIDPLLGRFRRKRPAPAE